MFIYLESELNIFHYFLHSKLDTTIKIILSHIKLQLLNCFLAGNHLVLDKCFDQGHLESHVCVPHSNAIPRSLTKTTEPVLIGVVVYIKVIRIKLRAICKALISKARKFYIYRSTFNDCKISIGNFVVFCTDSLQIRYKSIMSECFIDHIFKILQVFKMISSDVLAITNHVHYLLPCSVLYRGFFQEAEDHL